MLNKHLDSMNNTNIDKVVAYWSIKLASKTHTCLIPLRSLGVCCLHPRHKKTFGKVVPGWI